MIAEKHRFEDDNGREVVEHRIVSGQPPKGFLRFRGVGRIELELGNGRHANRTWEIRLPRATNLKEAFDQVDEELKAQKDGALREFLASLGLNQSAVAPATEADMKRLTQNNRILRGRGPNGRQF